MGSHRRPRPALQPLFSRRPIALSRRRAAIGRRDAGAGDGRTRMASAALDRRQGSAGDHTGAESARSAGRDRSHGPHRRPRRHGHRGFPEPAARGRRRLVLGEIVGRPSAQPQRARLSGCAAVSRSAGAGERGTAGVGRRLAASARRGRDARRRTSVRIVPDVDAGPADAAPHPRDQSRQTLWFSN